MSRRLDKVEENFLNTIRKYKLIEKGDKIVVGVSGGPDSTALLSCLNEFKNKLGCEIVVAHINHLIRKDAGEDEEFVKEMCNKIGVEFYSKKAEVEKIASQNQKSVEETGREIRYNFFNEIAQKVGANKIAVAHNMNDNVETFLLNLIRGAGLDGLEGIQPKRTISFAANNKEQNADETKNQKTKNNETVEALKVQNKNKITLIRPLIECERKDIENYCENRKLQPRIDSTNLEIIYKRNKIRNQMLPYMEKLNPNIIETINRTTHIIAENNEFINEEIEKNYEKVVSKSTEKIKDKTQESETKNTINRKNKSQNKISINIKAFNNLPRPIQEGIIRKAIAQIQGNKKNISQVNIADILKLANRNYGNKMLRVNTNCAVRVKQSKLEILRGQ